MDPVRLITVLLAGGLLLGSGCRPQVQQRKYHAVAGTASSIDLESGMVSMDRLNKKSGKMERFTGRVIQTTEILINGVCARLEDVREGDPAVVIVYTAASAEDYGSGCSRERARQDSDEWIVTAVRIEREETFILDRQQPAAAAAGSDAGAAIEQRTSTAPPADGS